MKYYLSGHTQNVISKDNKSFLDSKFLSEIVLSFSNRGNGLFFAGSPLLELSAHHNVIADFESVLRSFDNQPDKTPAINRHTNDVKPRDLTSVNIDYKQIGLGGDDSWGAPVHEEYRLTAKEYSYSFRMKAIAAGEKPEALAKLKL